MRFGPVSPDCSAGCGSSDAVPGLLPAEHRAPSSKTKRHVNEMAAIELTRMRTRVILISCDSSLLVKPDFYPRSLPQLVCSPQDDLIIGPERSQHLHQFAGCRSTCNVNPFDHSAVDTDDKLAPIRGDDACRRNEQNGTRRSKRPLYLSVHSWRQPEVGIGDIKFDRHGSCLRIE